MSMIGVFGICSKDNYSELVDSIKNRNASQIEGLIKEIYSELEISAATLENDKCSGEVFIALFHYLKIACGVDVRCGMEELGEKWRNTTGDFDIIVFHEKEQILSMEGTVDYNGLLQFNNEFFQIDYGDAGRIAWNVLLNNLKSTGTENILIWHLF